MPTILTVEEAAKVLRVSEATVRRNAPRWGGFKMPGARRWLFRRSVLEEQMKR
jgi:excisionase family DNA binding protein